MAETYSQAEVDKIIAERDALKEMLGLNFCAIINLYVCLDEPGTDAGKLLAVKEMLDRMTEPGEHFAPMFSVLHRRAEPGKH